MSTFDELAGLAESTSSLAEGKQASVLIMAKDHGGLRYALGIYGFPKRANAEAFAHNVSMEYPGTKTAIKSKRVDKKQRYVVRFNESEGRFDELAGLTESGDLDESDKHHSNKGRLVGVFNGLEGELKRWRTKHTKGLEKKDPHFIVGLVDSLLNTLDRSIKSGRSAIKGLD
jgi:hypothetical protein